MEGTWEKEQGSSHGKGLINLSKGIQNKIEYLSKWYQAKQDLQEGMSYKQPDT